MAADSQTTLAVGQIWVPSDSRRARSREIVAFGVDSEGYPEVVWSEFWTNCGHTGRSHMRRDSFRTWIRKHSAVLAELENHGQ
jgi:hypothetical protein